MPLQKTVINNHTKKSKGIQKEYEMKDSHTLNKVMDEHNVDLSNCERIHEFPDVS